MELKREFDDGHVYRSVVFTAGAATFDAALNFPMREHEVANIKSILETKDFKHGMKLKVNVDAHVTLTITSNHIACHFQDDSHNSFAKLAVDVPEAQVRELLKFLIESGKVSPGDPMDELLRAMEN